MLEQKIMDRKADALRRHTSEKTPVKFAPAQDRPFTMNSAKFQEMLHTEDFWWYFILRMEAGQHDIAEAVLGDGRDHNKTSAPFRPTQ